MPKPLLTLLFYLVLVWPSVSTQGQDKGLQYYYSQGIKACDDNRFRDCLSHLDTANRIRPGHQIIMFQLARAYSLNSMIDSSEHYLKRALSIKADFDLSDSAFSRWSSTSRFAEILDFQQHQMSPVSLSEAVTYLKDRTLHIESIAYDPIHNRLYLGSVYKQKILQVDLADGSISEYTATAEHGMWSVFGMKVDAQQRHLWVCTVATELMINADSSLLESAAVYKLDLDSGKVLQRYAIDDGEKHWFGDMTISPAGKVYVSDSRANTVFLVNEPQNMLEPFVTDPQFMSLQGLDVDPGGNYLFLADYVNGLYRIDLQNKKLKKLHIELGLVSLKSVDGLYFHGNSLITTQNQVVPMRVTQYFLNDELDTIVNVKYLEKGNPLLNEPTLGVIDNNWFYYVANSQWSGYDQLNRPKSYHELQDIYIMKVKVANSEP